MANCAECSFKKETFVVDKGKYSYLECIPHREDYICPMPEPYWTLLKVRSKDPNNKVTQIGLGSPEDHILTKHDDIVKEDDCLIIEYYKCKKIFHIEVGCFRITEIEANKNIYSVDLEDVVSIAFEKDFSRRIYGLPLDWLKIEMLRVATENEIPQQAEDTWRHSAAVYEFAKDISNKAVSKPQVTEHSLHILEKGCYAHDFGRMFTGSPASREVEPGILHGFYGANYFRNMVKELTSESSSVFEKEEFESYARICERHIGGAGFTKSSIKNIPTLRKNMIALDILAENFYEKVIGYADWRIHAVKCGNIFVPTLVSEEEVMKRTLRYNPPKDQIEAIEKLCQYIHNITNEAIK